MDYLLFLLGVFTGLILGAGLVLIYLRWRMTRQINAMQQNMDGMFAATEELMEEEASMEESFEEEEE